MPVRRRSPVSLVAVAALATALVGCGGDGAAYACSGNVCTVRADGPTTLGLDELGTKIALSDLTADAVRVRINADAATVGRGRTVRLRGFLVTATKTGADHAEVRLER